MGKTALIAGATGLVGRELVRLLLSDPYYDRVKVVTRRPIDIKDDRLEELIVPDFDELDRHAEALSATHYYVTLGTTMRKAGSKENFRYIDINYPMMLAEMAQRDPSFEKFLVVTAYQASLDSKFFYNRVKAELEAKLKELHLPSLYIFQPSLLIGARSDFRIFEEAAKIVMPILVVISFGQIKFRAIRGRDVAKAMLKVGKEAIRGTHIYPNNKIKEIAVSSLPPEEIEAE